MTDAPNKPEEEPLADDSPTDELPVLTELDVVEDASATIEIGVFADETARHARPGADALDDTGHHARVPSDDALDDTGHHARVPSDDAPDDTAERARPPGAAPDATARHALHEPRRRNGDAHRAPGSLQGDERERRDALIADREATIASLEERLAATREAVLRRDRTEAALRVELDRRQQQIEGLEGVLAEARQIAERHEREARERAAELAEAERELEKLRHTEQELLDWLVGEEQTRETLKAELERSRARIEELEAAGAGAAELGAQIDALEGKTRDLAAKLDERTRELGAELARATGRAEALAAELDGAKAKSAALAEEIETHRARTDALAAEARSERARADALEAEARSERARAAALEAELEAARATPNAVGEPVVAVEDADVKDADDDELTQARLEAAALAAYIENRRAHWNEMEARLAEREAEIDVLRREGEQRERRQREAEEAARNERASARRLKREVAELRAAPRRTAREDSATIVDPRRAGLESELEGLRREVETLRRMAAEKDAELARMAERQTAVERELDETEARRAAAQASADRFERLLREHGQDATGTHAGAGVSAAHLLETASGRSPFEIDDDGASSERTAARRTTTPMLVCLTGDAPRTYRLAEATMTIGRGHHCDIQIPTQFVSREHARIEVGAEKVDIVDLGSRNGVFVNSVRVDREVLRHGDLVTIGETQFRFLAD